MPRNTQQFYIGCILAALFVILLIIEFIRPLRRRKNPFLRRFIINIILSALAFITGSLVVRHTALYLTDWTSNQSFGLLHFAKLPIIGQHILGFILMDLTFYYWHRANHIFGILWRFHNVHHLDPDLDVSTSFRFHFFEVLYSTLFRSVQVGLIGIRPVTYIVYEIFFQAATMFHHSNFRLPLRLERWLNIIIVTPRMHGIHHSNIREETNSNYSVIFRTWDRLHKTLCVNIPQADVDIGVPAYRQIQDNSIGHLIMLPFIKQKDYWHFPDGTDSKRSLPPLDEQTEKSGKYLLAE